MKPPANGDSEDLENLVGVVGFFFADWDPGNNCRSMDSRQVVPVERCGCP